MKARRIGILAVLALMIVSGGGALADETLAPETLARNIGCLECHSVDRKVIGPSYHDIAAKYRNVDGARVALIEKVKNGGKGNWTEVTGDVLMPPHSARLSDEEVQRLVDWILGL